MRRPEGPERSFAEIRNCILWDRGNSLWANDGSTLDVVYSDVQGGWPGQGNRDVDPAFVDPGHWDEKGTPEEPADDIWFDGDYRLAWQSPCVDAGDPRETPDAATRDFAGRPRRSGVAVDMGAYELQERAPDRRRRSQRGGILGQRRDGQRHAGREPARSIPRGSR